MAGLRTHRAHPGDLPAQPLHRGAKGFCVVEGHEQPVVAVLDELMRGGVVEAHHSQAAGHGLGQHVAEGLGDARKQEEVGRCVVGGQVFTAAQAGKDGGRATLLQARAFRAVTHQHQACRAVHRLQRLKGLQQRAQVLLSGQPADTHHHHVGRPGAPLLAQRGAAACRVEEPRVHAARDHAHTLEAGGLKLGAQAFGGHHRACGAVMKLAQVSHDRVAQPGHTIVFAVGMEVGAKVAHHRQLQVAGGLQRRPAERPFGDQVHHIRPLQRPQLLQRAPGRQAHLELWVARDRQAAHQHFGKALFLQGGIALVLARPQQLQLVAAVVQAVDHARNGGGHTVDFGRVGFTDHCHTQRTARGQDLVDFQLRCAVHVHLHAAHGAKAAQQFDDSVW